MNRLYILSLILLCLVFSNCKYQSNNTSDSKNSDKNLQQEKFITFMRYNHDAYESISNDINKSEYVSNYEKELALLADSLRIFRNWQGRIDDIQIFDWSTFNSKEITVTIVIKVSDFYDLTLSCKKMYSTKELDSSLVYRQLKMLNKGQIVYFDGLLSRDNEKKVEYDVLTDGFGPDNGKLTNIHMNFNIISIFKDKFIPKNSTEFNRVIESQFDIWKSLNDNKNSNISRSSLLNKLNQSFSEIKPTVDSLSYDEKQYIKSMSDCLGYLL